MFTLKVKSFCPTARSILFLVKTFLVKCYIYFSVWIQVKLRIAIFSQRPPFLRNMVELDVFQTIVIHVVEKTTNWKVLNKSNQTLLIRTFHYYLCFEILTVSLRSWKRMHYFMSWRVFGLGQPRNDELYQIGENIFEHQTSARLSISDQYSCFQRYIYGQQEASRSLEHLNDCRKSVEHREDLF